SWSIIEEYMNSWECCIGACSSQAPPLSVFAANEAIGGGQVGGAKPLAVPNHTLADADGDVAQEHHFRERTCVIDEIRHCRRSTSARPNPLRMMSWRARQRSLRRLEVAEILLRQEHIVGAVIGLRKQSPPAADHERPARSYAPAMEQFIRRPTDFIPLHP